MVTLYPHQDETVKFLAAKPRAFIASTMGCGKSLCIVRDVERFLSKHPGKKVLILAPKSLLHSVWETEFADYAINIVRTSVGTAPTAKREAAFQVQSDVYITNVDALDWLAKKPASFFSDFDYIAIDESTTIKNNSARTKAAQKIKKHFYYRRLLSGTPTAGPLIDLFYQYLFLDDGQRLGTSYYAFRNKVMYSKQNGPHPKMVSWANRPMMEKVVATAVGDITIRYVLEEVVNMPPKVTVPYSYVPNAKVMKAYKEMLNQAEVQLQSGTVSAVNAAAMTTKLLQIASGAVYDSTGNAHLVDTQRYDLVLDIADNTQYSVVFYNWKSQREHMMAAAQKRGISATFIDGSVTNNKRRDIVNDFQAGRYRIIFLQVKAASHGLTFTRAYTTIWACPSYLADYYQQANARVYRIGQKHRTLTINIAAENTLDNIVYKKLNGKINDIDLLNEAIRANRP